MDRDAIPGRKPAVFLLRIRRRLAVNSHNGEERRHGGGRTHVNDANKPLILVVDDEKDIRTLVRLMLEEGGYRVIDAESGKDAIAIAANADDPISLLVTDILMPFMNGRDLADKIASIRPTLKVLFISAYSAEILTAHNLCPEGSDYIKKPFTAKTLLAKVAMVLGQPTRLYPGRQDPLSASHVS
jgi:CheY-like chemotaxis protein